MDSQGKKGISKKPFAEHNSEFVSEHEESEKSPPVLRRARKRNELEGKVEGLESVLGFHLSLQC